MGGGQSTDSTADLRQKNKGCLPSQNSEPPPSQSPDTDHGSPSLEPDSELPQRRICSKNVDDMSFMISCTNWY
ncbi:hypothetical protein AMEX_G7717 [Astyanax mexicanus]|uniref:Uncharacterized protein n=2 Tax=Astyanax mexicanus TaxID=7994 RepID=A0A8T2KJ31_ASTMX|nr:hypothetical protein AMEX_G28025 [Astyanax mexicanus]KAG9277687.1 hypothetical protein AMEX_G7717 [Astyanax mexicanus]